MWNCQFCLDLNARKQQLNSQLEQWQWQQCMDRLRNKHIYKSTFIFCIQVCWCCNLQISFSGFVLQILSDDEKRPLYDHYGEAGLKGAGTAAAAQGAAGYAGSNTFDLFEAFFGGTSGGGAFGGMGGMGGMGGSMGGMGSSFGTRRRPTSVQGDDIR
jgi:uncharacterized membrane protein YgcG